jgi:DNA-binding GntR family transcriptional regulator
MDFSTKSIQANREYLQQMMIALERPNLKDAVASVIRMLIFSGHLKPGQKIDQDKVAEDLNVSKNPVREALITLESEGLVETVARRGAFVAPLTPTDVSDHFEIFGLISAVAVTRATDKLTERDFSRLERLIQEMEQSDNPLMLEKLNFQFHQLINKIGSSRRLISVIALLYNSIPLRFYEYIPSWAHEASQDHREILGALKERDAERAAAAMTKHLRRSGDEAVRLLSDSGFWDEQKTEA